MNQILHIFKKDAAHHWPEILLSMALLSLFTHNQLHPWKNFDASFSFSPSLFIFADRYVAPALITVWVFLIVRVLQGESLVGDRQWWVTKPYEWRDLLAAKILFIFVFISVPLFHVQLLLLHHFGLPVFASISSLLPTQVSLYLLLFLPTLLLASVTKSTGQFFLTVAGMLSAVLAIALLSGRNSQGNAENPPPIIEHLQVALLSVSIVALLVWQFARRKRWLSVGAFFGMLLVYSLMGGFPNAKTIEASYPRVERQTSPAHVVIAEPEQMGSARNAGLWPNAGPEVNLSIPITVSGIASETMVAVDLVKVTAESSENSKWSEGWKYQRAELWPEDEWKPLFYAVSREEYEKIKTKPVNLHIEFALSEYLETDTRVRSLPPSTFVDGTLGVCRLNAGQFSPNVQCLKPFQASGLMATVDAQQFSCPGNQKFYAKPQEAIFHDWEPINDYSFPQPVISSITEDSLWFRPVSLRTVPGTKSQLNNRSVALCPGAEIRLARPKLKRRFRIQLEMPNVRLEDLVYSGGE